MAEPLPQPNEEERQKINQLESELDEVWHKLAQVYPHPYRPLYYKLNDRKEVVSCTLFEFSRQIEHPESRKVGRDQLGPLCDQ